MDFSMLNEYMVFVVMIACLIIGYIIKNGTWFKKINNNDIPMILAAVGLVMNLFVSGFSIESAVYGAAMGLLSTGCYEGFKNFIHRNEQK